MREIKSLELLRRRPAYYTAKLAGTALAFAATWYAFVLVGDSWYQTIVAAVMGFAFTQVAFLGHDGGHQQIFRSKRLNDSVGLITGNLMVGLSYGWWVHEHNQHHSHPNHEGRDPDIGDSVLAFTKTQAATRGGPVLRFIARYQAFLFFPLLTLEGINLHVASMEHLLTGRPAKRRRLEYLLLAVHLVAYLSAVLLVLSPVKALVFVAINQAVWGIYMGCSFAPNHKGMPMIAKGTAMDFLRCQVLTTRNVRGGRFTDFLLGGLNYQVEHHLFPNMPRPSLRRAQPIIKAYCAKHDILFTETSLIGSYAAALRHLHAIGAPLRARAVPVAVKA